MLKIKKTNTEINLIVALGNVGKSYAKTRHNAGFLFADVLNKYLDDKGLIHETETNNLYFATIYPTLDLRILEPTTMMNNSGQAVQKYIKMNEGKKFSPLLLLVHDDLDLHLEEYKLSFGKSPRSHNGVASVENLLGGNKDFWRLRIGIDNRDLRSREMGIDYVLQRFSAEEQTKLDALLLKIVQEEFSIS